MINQNVSDANSDFDKTVYEGEVFAVIDTEAEFRRSCDALTGDRIDVTNALELPKGKHLVKISITAEIMKSQPLVIHSNAPDDLAQEDMAMVFEQTNGKVPALNGVTDLF